MIKYINPTQKMPLRRSIQFPNELVWEIHFVKAIDTNGTFRLGLVLVKPRGRVMFEIAPIPSVESRNDIVVAFLSKYLLEETPWYGRPRTINIGEKSIRIRLKSEAMFRDIEFQHCVTPRRIELSQHYFSSSIKRIELEDSCSHKRVK